MVPSTGGICFPGGGHRPLLAQGDRLGADRTLAARVAVTALQQAVARRQPPPGVVHHSDQGIQYACADYVEELKNNCMVPSMSRPANPYDNAVCESFMKRGPGGSDREILYSSEAGGPDPLMKRKWREDKVRPIPGNSPHDRTGRLGEFFIVKESLRRSLLHHSLLAASPDPEAPQDAFSQAGRNLSVRCGSNQSQNQNQILGRDRTASRWSAPSPGKRTRREDHALLIVRDEFRAGYSSIGLLASRARLRFTGSPIIKHWTDGKEGFNIER